MQIPPSISTIINWNGFLKNITEPQKARQESCAWIFADIKNDTWNILEVKNIGLKRESIKTSFAPDKKDFLRVKKIARENKWTRIGNVHTHIVIGRSKSEIHYQSFPSDPDLIYARRFNDIIRAIIVVQFKDINKKGKIRTILWFDQYGNILQKEKL